ncbi:hypothetical protein BGZ57DRAFT_931304 [Hyaloscypha finlandica]|nr:hypothetical protein BGZ57DRAFT_931304 [Hyaloscypha finlandica]
MSAGDLSTRFASQRPAAGWEAGTEKKVEGGGKEAKEGEVEAEVCWICASPIVHESIAPCNHRTCHICCLRMRALYKDKNCAHCRTPAPYVIFSNNPTKRYEDFTNKDIASTDENIGIRYESNDIREDTILLLRYNCPDDDCDVACLGWPDLHRHVRSVHHKKICDLCSRHKKVFTHEHDLFTDQELQKHMRKGDDNPGAVDQTGFKGHPLCSFCGLRFYGEDELYVHCREKHERCFICDRLHGGQPQYYLNYEALYAHLKKDHFVCEERECLEKKLVAFDSELDLKAHQLQEHGNTLSKDVRRDARVVDISSFDYRAPYVQERRGGGSQREQREGRGRGRGRDPNTDPIPASSAQPLRRDEQAFQRQMAIHSAQSVSTRTFGGQLTPASASAAARPPPPAAMSVPRPSASVEAATQAVNSLDLSQTDLTPQEQARHLRHRDVIERASLLLQNDPMKITRFRDSISSYKNNAISAPLLIDSFFALFTDTTSSALGTLIREVADLYDDAKKADTLRTAWNNWRAINEDYPSLPAASGSSSSSIPLNWAVTSSTPSASTNTNTNTKSTRVLKLKSSTAQSSRSSVSQTRSWGTASPPISSSSLSNPLINNSYNNPFPTLPPPTSSRPQNTSSTKVSTIPWIPQTASANNSNPGSARPTPPTSRPASTGPVRGRGAGGGGAEFPALPPAAKPQSTIFGYGRGMVRRDGLGGGGASVASAWGNGGASTPPVEGVEQVEEEAGKGKKKGNKGKKQVLMNWG